MEGELCTKPEAGSLKLEAGGTNPETGEWKREECGIVAIYSKKGTDVAPLLHNALVALQHRGQDAAGFAVFNGKLYAKKGLGLVNEIFKPKDFEVKGSVGIGHTRYPTSGYIKEVDAQPFVFGKIAIAHNGHIANYSGIKAELEKRGHRYKSSVDSETVAFMLYDGIKEGAGIEGAVKSVMETVDGAYSIAGIIDGKLTVFRDPHAIRPLVYGENEDYICFASETCALDINGIPHKGDVAGGELVIIDNGSVVKKTLLPKQAAHCMFEYVYFSRADSSQNGKSVYDVRRKLGEELAREHPVKADVVVPIPDTSRTAAESYSKATGIPSQEGLIKNRYIGRTFIMPSQQSRTGAVRMKLNVVREVVEGKRVVLIDDSIVRGTTLREIAKMVRDAGAKEIHVRITCPPLKAPCFYGVDMKTYKELIAHNKTVEEIRQFIGVESLGYISIAGLKKAIGLGQGVCTGCLDESYITPYARKLAKEKKDGDLGCG